MSHVPAFHLYSDARTPALVKHELLRHYLEQLAIRVGRSGWDSLLYVDGFAGPWGSSESCHDSSFGVAIETMARVERILNDRWNCSLNLHAILIERSKRAYPLLNKYAEKHDRKPVKITALRGRFENHVGEIERQAKTLGGAGFRFLLLDPKGWKGLAMDKIRPIAQARSSEILVNVMVKFLVRFLKEEDRADSYREFFGREGVREIVQSAKKEDRPDILVREYCKSLKQICGFKYVSSCLVLNEDKSQVRYFMVFATNHHKGIEVFKDAETHASSVQIAIVSAIQKKKREQRNRMNELPLLDESRHIQTLKAKYARVAFAHVRKELELHRRILYRDAFCEAAAFPLVSKSMIHEQLRSMSGVSIELEHIDGKARKTPNCDREDYCVLR